MTRADQWRAFARALAALIMVIAITIAATIDTLRIGPAAAGLLYLLPVLWVSAQAGLTAGLVGAAFSAFCYNFFLLEPRYTLRIHGVGDIAAFVVLTAVAVVTSRLAAGLRAREIEARAHAEASAMEAEFTILLARAHDRATLDAHALDFFRARHGEALLVASDDLAARRTPLAPLDAAAAAWALHNDALSGHASEVMPSADFRFIPLSRGGDVLALAAGSRPDPQAGHVALTLARLWVQARDRLTADAERRAREQAEQREAVRRTLLAALGHDFRTPLTILKSGLAELGGEPARRLGAEVDRIARLSEDLIAAARLEGGSPTRLEPIDLVDIIAAAIPPHAPVGIHIRTDIADDLPLACGDAVMLVHLVGNLVDNGVRHARSSVAITARGFGDQVELEVRDDGAGIDPAIVDSLFDPFVAGSDREGGSGLGLAIARDLARAMGATLSAANVASGGACFVLRLARFAVADPSAA